LLIDNCTLLPFLSNGEISRDPLVTFRQYSIKDVTMHGVDWTVWTCPAHFCRRMGLGVGQVRSS